MILSLNVFCALLARDVVATAGQHGASTSITSGEVGIKGRVSECEIRVACAEKYAKVGVDIEGEAQRVEKVGHEDESGAKADITANDKIGDIKSFEAKADRKNRAFEVGAETEVNICTEQSQDIRIIGEREGKREVKGTSDKVEVGAECAGIYVEVVGAVSRVEVST